MVASEHDCRTYHTMHMNLLQGGGPDGSRTRYEQVTIMFYQPWPGPRLLILKKLTSSSLKIFIKFYLIYGNKKPAEAGFYYLASLPIALARRDLRREAVFL